MAADDVKRKLTAIFSADVQGYSRLMGEDELSTVQTLTSHKETMRNLIKQYRGRVVDSTGDNLLAEFTSVVDAVQCAVEVQQILKTKNEELPENRRMFFRIGINSGDVIEEGDRIFGDGVNIAARVESLAEGGGISLSGTAYDQLGKKLPLGYEFLGEQSVKNIEKPVRVYRVLTEAEAAGKVIGEEGPRPKQWRWAAIGAVVVLFLVAGVFTVWNFYLRPDVEPASVEKMAFPLPDKPSIAVLPFVDMSEEKGQEYLSNGLTEEIITALSKVPKLFVIAGHSTFSYKGKSVKVNQAAEELGVQYVLEGSVRRAGERVRITTQLIDALTGRNLWAERYERDLKDIFDLQDEVTMKIITALEVELTEGETARLFAKGTHNLDAYLNFLKGLEQYRRGTKEGIVSARRFLEKAIALDPEYPSAYSWLGVTHMMDYMYRRTKSPKQSLNRAIQLAQKAIALDESEATAHGLLGFLYVIASRQYDKGIAEGRRAVALNPNGATENAWLSLILRYGGKCEEAVQIGERAIRLNPMTPGPIYVIQAWNYICTERYEQAIKACKSALKRTPNSLFAHLVLAIAYSLSGREEEAHAEAKEVLRISPKFSLEKYAKEILRYKNKAFGEKLANALRKAGLPEKPPLPLPDKPSIAVLPFTNMSGDPKQEYLSDGISEEIITALSKTPKLFVIARNSSFSYKGKHVKVPQVGRELGVKYVLEGSVRKAENKVRITAQLVDAQTGHQLWAERYDRDLKDIFALYDEITMKVIMALRVKLTDGEKARLSAKGTANLKAWLIILQAREPFYTMTKEGFAEARRLCEKSISLDPEYAAAYVYLGSTHFMDASMGSSKSPKESLKRAFELFTKAIALDDSYSVAHSMLGLLYARKGQYEKGIAECEHALVLEPGSADAHQWMGAVYRRAGNYKEAIRYFEQAIRLNPFPAPWNFRSLGMAYTSTGRYEEAIAAYKNALHLAPDDILTHLWLTIAYSLVGHLDEARAQAADVLRVQPKFSLKRFAKRLPVRDKTERDRYIDALRKAWLPDKPPEPVAEKPSIAVLPFANVSGDPEQDYLSDGITETLITDLSKISDLFVISRNSVFRYKGKHVDIMKVGRDLGVKHVLEGSVQKAGNQLRITAQLIDVSTDGHLWAERYDGKFEDTFGLQDEITGQIVKALAVQLTPGEQERVARKDTENITAYDSFLKGRAYYLKHTPEDFAKALSHFENAIEADPNYRQAYFFMALIYSKASKFGKRWLDALDLRNALVAEGQAKTYLELSKFKIVFVTSEKYTGNLGGIAGACEKCQRLSEAAGLPGTYRAWLSDKTSSPSTTFTRWDGPYVLVDGNEVAGNWQGLTEELYYSNSVPINITETGKDAGDSLVWTNTIKRGDPWPCPCPMMIPPVRDGSCQNWTSSDWLLHDAIVGKSSSNRGWTYVLKKRTSRPTTADCDEMLRLYCFQQ